MMGVGYTLIAQVSNLDTPGKTSPMKSRTAPIRIQVASAMKSRTTPGRTQSRVYHKVEDDT